jgi:hypothetical protein
MKGEISLIIGDAERGAIKVNTLELGTRSARIRVNAVNADKDIEKPPDSTRLGAR